MSISSFSFRAKKGHQPFTLFCLKIEIMGTSISPVPSSMLHCLAVLAPRGKRFKSSSMPPMGVWREGKNIEDSLSCETRAARDKSEYYNLLCFFGSTFKLKRSMGFIRPTSIFKGTFQNTKINESQINVCHLHFNRCSLIKQTTDDIPTVLINSAYYLFLRGLSIIPYANPSSVSVVFLIQEHLPSRS